MVYVLNRDQAANLTISSPLDAHKSHNIVFSIAGLDMGFDNPVFAAIELDYADADQACAWLHAYSQAVMVHDLQSIGSCAATKSCLSPALRLAQDPTGEAAAEAQKHLTLYELDLGLNHVVRKWSQPVDNGANLLIPVPGGADGPGGVLICAENFMIYSNQVRAAILLPFQAFSRRLLLFWGTCLPS